MNTTHHLRRRIGALRQRVTGADLAALRTQLAELSGEVSTLAAQLQQTGHQPVQHAQVTLLSDLRLPGGTTASIAEEVRAQAEAGITTALIHAQSEITSTATGFSRHIQPLLALPGVHVVSPRAQLRTQLLVIRHPQVIATAAAQFRGITAEQVVIVANHPAADSHAAEQYNVAAADAAVRQRFGTAPVWAPISPVVRASLTEQSHTVQLAEQDWVNIFGTELTTRPRTGFAAGTPVIGRHSRPQKEKWPEAPEPILAAYPDSPDYRVEILGGAEIPQQMLGYTPQNWQVLPFGAEEPARFLQGIDFWVYMHHPGWREAFGRAIIEALAAGCLVVLPPYLETIFGDAARYAEPHQVRPLVDRYWEDKEAFLEQSRRGQQFAAAHGPQRHLARLAQRGIGATGESQP
ncbi:glycosyltransferase [Nesterenkonia alkaliphila]|uniref:glycosyltransferase n=1 Tax=Nesterenkonia alkaliphila TaxID=1463631 RepID=UPI001665618D|nr:hypothetical protein [Nesterenkonia alkaliphila]